MQAYARLVVCIAVGAAFAGGVTMAQDGRTLVDFGPPFDTAAVEVRDVTIETVDTALGAGLRIRSGHAEAWPGITLKPAAGRWDVTGFRTLRMAVTNTGGNRVEVGFRIDNPGGDGARNCVQVVQSVEAGTTQTIRARLSATRWTLRGDVEIVGMRGTPGKPAIAPDNIVQIIVFVPKPREDHEFVIHAIEAEEPTESRDAEGFFPFIDGLGQFVHADWPGKVHGEEELARRRQAEARELGSHPGPGERNRYGGWAAGPQLEATGFFRVEKRDGRWWLVDPEGRLFWSHGVDCVNAYSATGITDREHYFQSLPDREGPLGTFYGKGGWAPHGYYKGKTPFDTFDFYRANLSRKYGPDWQAAWSDLCHLRLRSWGLNTIANWSSAEVYGAGRTPYVATVHIGGPVLAGSEGYWGKFHDVFDPGFRAKLAEQLRGKAKEAADPWCIGFFVDNELAWGDELSLALAALASPAGQAAKREFVARLRQRYDSIGRLNEVWGTAHAAWEDLLSSQDLPDREKARDDLSSFYTATAETYFRTVKEELAAVAPHHLYLGCRFAWVNDRAVRAAIRFCDVVSYNRYEYSVAGLRLPDAADRPVIIGEFHFGALDRGMFHTGLREARDQGHRAELYQAYVEGALRNPLIVGTHWFQFADQPVTGRGDGENYQIGFVDQCDSPYPEIVAAARRIGNTLYDLRSGR
ncbi:MAG: beta-agarase [Lentisphaeria bacterium]|nr:beta-agarase [Lentisphaeria bacterium]